MRIIPVRYVSMTPDRVIVDGIKVALIDWHEAAPV
jgi:hypothetical protein